MWCADCRTKALLLLVYLLVRLFRRRAKHSRLLLL
jgi:hypothetical protein